MTVKSMTLTTKTGPPACDISTRTIRCAITCKLLDKCNVQDTPDRVLLRELPVPTDIVVELVMDDAVKLFKAKGPDVCEIVSPLRIVAETGMRKFGNVTLKPGWYLDPTQVDPDDGKPWDLTKKDEVEKLWKLFKKGRPYCIMCSPPCTMYSILQGLNTKHWTKEEYEAKLAKARQHITICREVCRFQTRENRFFVYEHPAEARSWLLEEVDGLRKTDGVHTAEFDMCRFGLRARDDDGFMKPAKKSTRMLTNSWEIARRLQLKCPNRRCGKDKQAGRDETHEHTPLLGGGEGQVGTGLPKGAMQDSVCWHRGTEESRETSCSRHAYHEP